MRSKLPVTVIALGLTSFFTDVASEMVFPLLPGFLALLGAGPTFLGLLEGVADAVSALIKYLAGARSDVTGRRKSMVLTGYGLATLVRPLLALAGSPWHVLGIRATDRVGKGVRTAPRDALLAAAVPASDVGRAFGFHRAMDHAGSVVGPLLATLLLFVGLSVRTVFALTLVPGVLALVAVWVVKDPPPVEPPAAPAEASAPIPRRLAQLLGLFFFFALANSSDAFLLVRASELGTPTPWLPVLWVVLHLAKMTWAARAGAWSDRVPRHRLVLAGWAVYAVCYGLLALADARWQVWVVMAAYGAFAGLTEPVEKAMVKDLAPPAARGRAFGLYHGLLGAAAIPAGLLTGALWEGLGAPVALWTGASVAAVAALGLFWWSRQPDPDLPAPS